MSPRRALAAVLVASCWVVASCGTGQNKGEDTSCPDFLKMSASQRHEVIEKMGYSPTYTTNAKQVAEAVAVCREQQPDTTVGDALGP